MSQAENNKPQVRHIPIFVEGRDQPVCNDSNQPTNSSSFASASAESHSRAMPGFEMPPMPSASIFERAKDFPVRDFGSNFFGRSASPSARRSESPARHMPSYHQAAGQQVPPKSNSGNSQQWNNPTASQQQQQYQQNQQQKFQQQQADRKPTLPKENEVVDGPPPAPQNKPPMEDSITKIQKIQSSVLALMDSVDKFDGKSRKEYLYLDEMLTQNLLKLDTIDAEGKENIKQARREAIRCVNGLISVLEAKLEANEQAPNQSAKVESSDSSGKVSSSQNGLGSKNSSYDNVSNSVTQDPVSTSNQN